MNKKENESEIGNFKSIKPLTREEQTVLFLLAASASAMSIWELFRAYIGFVDATRTLKPYSSDKRPNLELFLKNIPTDRKGTQKLIKKHKLKIPAYDTISRIVKSFKKTKWIEDRTKVGSKAVAIFYINEDRQEQIEKDLDMYFNYPWKFNVSLMEKWEPIAFSPKVKV